MSSNPSTENAKLPAEDLVAVVHVIEGAETEAKARRVHYSLAFISGLSMPYVAYKKDDIPSTFADGLRKQLETLRDAIRGDENPPTTLTNPGRNPVLATRKGGVTEKEWNVGEIKRTTSRRSRLCEMGSNITRMLKFSPMLEVLYALRDRIDHVHIVTNIGFIPWDMLCIKSPGVNEYSPFLADLFGIGLSSDVIELHKAKAILTKDIDQQIKAKNLKPIISHYFTSYEHDDDSLLLPNLDSIISNDSLELGENSNKIEIETHPDLDPEDLTGKIASKAERSGLIILSGHFSKEGYNCSAKGFGRQFVRADDLEGALSSSQFVRRPVVILGGCESATSGRREVLSSSAKDDGGLTRAFIKAGAGACLVTDEIIDVEDYDFILRAIVKKLCNSASIGLALHQVRKEIVDQKLGDQLEFAAYRMHISGDPTSRIF